ncbi:hypothetical protein [Erythrobacter sp. JK5]|uniref:hypothetical protein n=1 Tax=Erythrobacter sp. JK5 TaxID=2829500 RepID=UPI001BADCB9A|nr:hypothetical protein [Erythrobacter sp. JK5]QUL36791.1 hypothetical protein KDC96_10215 [Erythrobacter sp. JK5]
MIEAADADLQAGVAIGGSSLTLRAAPGEDIGLGSGTGGFQLSDAELDRIDVGTLIIDAVDRTIAIGDVSFADQTGSDEVVLATSGGPDSIIRITGDISGAGASRLFRFGGDADTGSMLADRIVMDIESATIDFGGATFELRGEDIVFGQQALIDAVAGLASGEIASNFVGDANSLLYNPLLAGGLGGARINDPVYLRVGNIRIAYGNSALFQNTALPADGGTIYTGVELGGAGSPGTLTLDATDDTNAFALFGEINELVGTAAALAGGNVIIIGGGVSITDSRVNGCIIGSGADCVTTIIGSTTIAIPREAVSLLTADSLQVPFDPLVGTNNEGLFSDAAAEPEDDCERDQDGACIES